MGEQNPFVKKVMEKRYSYIVCISCVCASIPLKLVSSIYYIFPKENISKNYEECFFFHLKSSFRSGEIRFFVLLDFFKFKKKSYFYLLISCLLIFT